MKFKLSRYVVDQQMFDIICKEIERQSVHLSSLRKNKLKELSEIIQAITTRGLPQNLLCKKLPQGLGHGIFLHPKAKPILKGQIIAPYSGEVYFVPQNLVDDSLYAFELLSDILLSREEQSRFDPKRRYQPKRLYAFYVDALKKGNFARFINHSHEPNLAAELYKIPKNPYGLAPSPIEVIYSAKKKIQPGEQLLVSYDGDDDSYWGGRGMKPLPIIPSTFKLNSSLRVIGSV